MVPVDSAVVDDKIATLHDLRSDGTSSDINEHAFQIELKSRP